MLKSKGLRNIWYTLSANQRFVIRRLYYLPLDLFDKITGKGSKYVPPRGLIYTGSPDNAENFIKQGKKHLQLLRQEINIQPNDTILDIGSGIGRTAIVLIDYLNEEGRYEGFDVVKTGIDWCNKRIKKDFENFNFKFIPLFNDLYNKEKLKATEFKFPYPKKHFDKIFSFSVFTHMQVDEIQHYFFEISEVLKKNGQCFSTFFIYDDSNEEQISNNNRFCFPYKKDGFMLMNEQVKSGNIVIHKDKLKEMLSKSNLELIHFIEGFWKDNILNTPKNEFQDIVVFSNKMIIN